MRSPTWKYSLFRFTKFTAIAIAIQEYGYIFYELLFYD